MKVRQVLKGNKRHITLKFKVRNYMFTATDKELKLLLKKYIEQQANTKTTQEFNMIQREIDRYNLVLALKGLNILRS